MGKKKRKYDKGASVGFLMALPTVLGLILLNIYPLSLLKQAALMDPLTGAVCNPPEIWQMIDEMLVAQEEWLPQYKEGIEAAKTNLKEHYVTPRCEGYKGAAVVREKTVEEVAAEHAKRKITV